MEIKQIMDEVILQVEYMIVYHGKGSNSTTETIHKKVTTIPELQQAISMNKLDKLKEELSADEVFINSILIVGQSENGQTNTYITTSGIEASVNFKNQ